MSIKSWYYDIWLNRKGRHFNSITETFIYKNRQIKKKPPIKYDYINDFREGLSLVRVGDKETDRDYLFGQYGFLNTDLEYAITPQFTSAESFSEGLACVKVNDTWGKLSGEWGYINRKGEFVIKPAFDTADSFHEGVAVVSKDHKYWYIRKNGRALFGESIGKFCFHESFDYAEPFSEGRAFAKLKGEWVIVHKNRKKVLIIENHIEHTPFRNGIAFVSKLIKGKELWGAYNRKGKVVIPFEYDRIDGFVNGYARVYHNDRVAFINKSGKMLGRYHNEIPQIPWYFDAKDFSEGVAAVKTITDKWGFVDNKGRIVVDFVFDEVQFSGFDHDRCSVKKDGKWGVIDKKGNWISPNIYDNEILNYDKKLEVQVGDKWYSLTRDGKLKEID